MPPEHSPRSLQMEKVGLHFLLQIQCAGVPSWYSTKPPRCQLSLAIPGGSAWWVPTMVTAIAKEEVAGSEEMSSHATDQRARNF